MICQRDAVAEIPRSARRPGLPAGKLPRQWDARRGLAPQPSNRMGPNPAAGLFYIRPISIRPEAHKEAIDAVVESTMEHDDVISGMKRGSGETGRQLAHGPRGILVVLSHAYFHARSAPSATRVARTVSGQRQQSSSWPRQQGLPGLAARRGPAQTKTAVAAERYRTCDASKVSARLLPAASSAEEREVH